MRSSKRGRESVCVREREEGGKRKRKQEGSQTRKKFATVVGEKEKTGSRQETWATEDRASAKEAQLCQTEVTYLGYTLRDGKQWLKEARKKTVTQIPTPTTPRQVREFLGTAGFYRLQIPGLATLAAQLYPLTKEGEVFVWTPDHQKAFKEIKKALLMASLCLT